MWEQTQTTAQFCLGIIIRREQQQLFDKNAKICGKAEILRCMHMINIKQRQHIHRKWQFG